MKCCYDKKRGFIYIYILIGLIGVLEVVKLLGGLHLVLFVGRILRILGGSPLRWLIL